MFKSLPNPKKMSGKLAQISSSSLVYVFNLLFLVMLWSPAAAEYSLKIFPKAETLSKPSNQQFVLTCKGDGGDANLFSELKWFTPQNEEIEQYFLQNHPDFRIMQRDENLFLYFNNPKPEMSGYYKCRGLLQNSESLESKIQVTIYEDVTWDHCPEVQYLIKGNVGERINCRASANPKPNLIWTKGYDILDNNPRYFINSSGIVIKNAVTDDDGGLFRISAVVTETGATHEKRITVQIYSRPQIEKIYTRPYTEFVLDVAEGIENEQLEIQCEASGVPQPLYTWLDASRRNLSSVGGYAVDRNSGSIIISRLKRDQDRGNFTCIAENSAGKSERSIKVLVYQRPEIRSFRNESFDEFKPSFLECRARGDPMPKMSIRKDGYSQPFHIGAPDVRLEEKLEKDETILLLTFVNTTRQHDGLYYCSAENKAGKVEVAGHLQVKFRPSMLLTPLTHVKTWDSRPVNITCIADAIPNATIKWYKNGRELFEDDIYRISNNGNGLSRLYITPNKITYEERVFGDYACEGINSLGKSAIMIHLERATVPGMVNEVQIIDVTPTQVKFKILDALHDGGMPIKKLYVEYEARDYAGPTYKELPYSKQENIYIIDKLKPNTHYRFRFLAENEVGKGQYGQEKNIVTKMESTPDKPEFHNLPYDTVNKNEIVSPYPHRFTAMWNMPADNGREITHFEVSYYQIRKTEFGFTPLQEPQRERVSAMQDEMTSITLKKLKSNSFYRMELKAHNALGYSEPAIINFQTSPVGDLIDDDFTDVSELNISSLPIGFISAMIILAIIFILLIMDIFFYIRYKVGAIYFLKTHFCNIRDDDENKLSNFNTVISPSDMSCKSQLKYQTRAMVLSGSIEPRRTVEIDNPAFDYATHSSVEEHSPMLHVGAHERFGHPRQDQDSVV